jgi:hypothetical protein
MVCEHHHLDLLLLGADAFVGLLDSLDLLRQPLDVLLVPPIGLVDCELMLLRS